MSDESDGKRDSVSKSQSGSASTSALTTSSSGRKSSKKEKSSESGASTDGLSQRERKSERSTSGGSKSDLTAITDPKSTTTRESKSKKLREELAAANAEIARLRLENEDLREQLETLQSVISVQNEQRALTKKQQRRQKQKQQTGSATDVAAGAAEDSDEEEFDVDQETEMFDKAASSDDTQVKRKFQEHKRTRSNQMGTFTSSSAASALVDAELPPASKKRSSESNDGSLSSSAKTPLSPSSSRTETTQSDSPTPDAKVQQAPGTAPAGRSARPTRPTNSATPPRKAKFATATNLSRTFISQEDEKELVGGSSSTKGDTEARGRLMTNFALVSGQVNLHSLKIGVLGTPDPNAPNKSPSSSNDNDHPHIFDENTVLDILCGLGITSSRQFDDSPDGSVLIPRDFSYSYQFKVRRMQDQLLKFKDFAPKVFHQIRKVFNVSEAELLFSFRYDNLDAFKGAGKSGAFFIFSKDKRFILKTATKEERDFLWELLPYYLLYIRKHPNTLLPRFFGVYSMKHEGIGGVVRFVIMNNWFATFNEMKEKYDLKGSTVGRTVGSELNEEQKAKTILKDLDIKRKIYLPDQLYKTFMDQLKQDAAFLAEHNVMDYSLLVGMSDDEEAKALAAAAGVGGPDGASSSSTSSSVPSSPAAAVKSKNDARRRNMVDSSYKNAFQQYQHGTSSLSADSGDREIAYFGIIDVLQQYNTKKKLEHLIKSVRYEGDNISIVQPSYYAKRFIDFISSKFGPESEAAKLIAERNAALAAAEEKEEKEEKREKRRSNKEKTSAKKLKLSVPAKESEKDSARSKTPLSSDDEDGEFESSRSKRSNTVY